MKRLSDFRREEGGIAALEFALILPVMITLLFGLIEFPRAYGVSQGLSRAARTMADLISRGSLSDLTDVYAAGNSVTYPYDTSAAGIVLTVVGVYAKSASDPTLEARVCSSDARNATKRVANSVIGPPVPSEAVAGNRYVMAEVTFTYTPVVNLFPMLKGLGLSKTVTWPTRGTGANTNAQIVLGSGSPCP
ncbi:pilus assembly protein [Methylobacterium sp. C25]|uniref:TadE/TadG family type IV pilus assembly protein n=1 Tax=Methylobacterium sp. C25 TaxID=2721622 RepID=UPI001F17F186|nr:TadE/TadG family type IV pilus assembly protein [Methylobacterium sp. C25]MCE4222513.1 pilus assembly protein [Methylobacterium sp. C25]